MKHLFGMPEWTGTEHSLFKPPPADAPKTHLNMERQCMQNKQRNPNQKSCWVRGEPWCCWVTIMEWCRRKGWNSLCGDCDCGVARFKNSSMGVENPVEGGHAGELAGAQAALAPPPGRPVPGGQEALLAPRRPIPGGHGGGGHADGGGAHCWALALLSAAVIFLLGRGLANFATTFKESLE